MNPWFAIFDRFFRLIRNALSFYMFPGIGIFGLVRGKLRSLLVQGTCLQT
jgi:hypothetical protein